MLYVVLKKAKPYTRKRKGKLERVKGTYPGGYRFLGMEEWYEKHKGELWDKKKRRGFVPTSMSEGKKYKAFFGKARPGAEMAGFSGASFASNSGSVGRENWPPQPMPNYGKRKLRKKTKGRSYTEEVPLQGGGTGWVMS